MTFLLAYLALGLFVGLALRSAYGAGRLRWYNVLAGMALWPVVVVGGIRSAFRS